MKTSLPDGLMLTKCISQKKKINNKMMFLLLSNIIAVFSHRIQSIDIMADLKCKLKMNCRFCIFY